MAGDSKNAVNLTIDGRTCRAERSKTVLQVALENGVSVPYFCYHPYLSIPGNCRQCQVRVGMQQDGEVRWGAKLSVSCNTPVAEGMVVDTVSDAVKQAQAANMEFLLINHPLDCPICDQVGECWLQEQAYSHGPGKTRFAEEKVHFDKRVDIGPHVLLDKERCIKCTRCIRFCDEVTGTSELALVSRSDHTEVDIFPGVALKNSYSGNVVDICPVGALTLKEFRFQSRLWFLNTESSVCPGCARGCNVKVWHRDGAIARLTPRENPEINDTWICDEGRLISDRLHEQRVQEPRVDGEPADWGRALEVAAGSLMVARGGVAAVIRSWATLEESYLAIKLLEFLTGGAVQVAVPAEMRGEDDGLLVRADKTPNRRGLEALLAERRPGLVQTGALLEEAAAGRIGTLLVLGQDLFDAGVSEPTVRRALDAGLKIVLLAAHESRTAAEARVVLPAGTFPEVDGSYVSFAGRVQRVAAAYPPPYRGRTGVEILTGLAPLIGAGEPPSRPRDLLDEIGRSEPAFRGLSFDKLGAGGTPLPAAATAESR